MRQNYEHYNHPSEIPPATGILRDVQLGNLAILKAFDKICSENNIQYWLDFGTLLGAARHKGFIPWDDDIDLGVPRDDYEKVIRIIKDFPEESDLHILLSSNGRNKSFAKVTHKKLPGAFIDLFPYDFYHSKLNDEEKDILYSKIKKISHRLKYSLFRINDEEKLRKKLINITQKKILGNKKPDELDKPALFWGIDYPHAWRLGVYDWERIFPLGKIDFEGVKFPCPNDFDFVLRNVYGNYMKLPSRFYPGHTDITGMTKEEKEELKKIVDEGIRV